VLVLAALRRSTTFVALGMTLWGVLLTYWIGAILAGLLLGALKPLTKYRAGAFAVGTLVGLAVYGTAMLALPEAHDAPWWLVLIPAVLVGGGLGVVFYDDEEGSAAV
jgi:hypothetical protein